MRYLASIGAIFVFGGCIPYHLNDAPPVVGIVVNRATGKPIVAANVSMTAENRIARTQTDQSGKFRLPAIRHWIVAPVSDGFVDGTGTLRIEAPGYRPHIERRRGYGPYVERRIGPGEIARIPLAPKT